MGIDDLSNDVHAAYEALDDELTLKLDQETKHELAMLAASLDADPADLVTRGVHVLFQMSVETAKLDFHLRQTYGITYDEYLSGMTFDEMTGSSPMPQPDEDRRYNF